MEVLNAIAWLLKSSWDFFTEVNVPGFDFSFAALFVGLFLASLGLRVLFMMLGLNIGSSDKQLPVAPKSDRKIGF